MKKRIPIQQRFWGVVNDRNEVAPHSISFHRYLAIKRFIETPIYGFGGTWKASRRRGWRLVRLTITPHSENATEHPTADAAVNKHTQPPK